MKRTDPPVSKALRDVWAWKEAVYQEVRNLSVNEALSSILDRAERTTVELQGRHPAYTVAEKRERYPRAYEKWSDAEDAELQQLVRSGATVAQIARRLQRNRGAIRSRIMKLNLVAELTLKEQERLRRIAARAGELSGD